MQRLKVTSCLGENTLPAGRAVTAYLGRRLGITAEFVEDISWSERESLLEAGEIHIGWICGLLYVWKHEQHPEALELLAAPVLRDRRYRGQPVYYSDVIVRRRSPVRSFGELTGASWVYNERRSFSGYYVVAYQLARQGTDVENFFDHCLISGSHLNSLEMVIEGEADTAAIDSTILDFELSRQPELDRQIRVVETLGPNPVPPWIISRRLPGDLRQKVRDVLLDCECGGPDLLGDSQLARFVEVKDADYDPIRQVERSVRESSYAP